MRTLEIDARTTAAVSVIAVVLAIIGGVIDSLILTGTSLMVAFANYAVNHISERDSAEKSGGTSE